jgi:hypothetical protein
LSRVNGQLAVSRAFGDVNFKFSKEESGGGGAEKPLAERDYVVAPTTSQTPVTCRCKLLFAEGETSGGAANFAAQAEHCVFLCGWRRSPFPAAGV